MLFLGLSLAKEDRKFIKRLAESTSEEREEELTRICKEAWYQDRKETEVEKGEDGSLSVGVEKEQLIIRIVLPFFFNLVVKMKAVFSIIATKSRSYHVVFL